MKVVFQYLKPLAFILLLCVLLLFGQALSDLSLPNLMSDIVNIGLQKNGIDEPVPEQISEQGMELICLFMKEEERQAFQNVYEKQDGVYILSSAQSLQKAQEAYGQSALTLLYAVLTFFSAQRAPWFSASVPRWAGNPQPMAICPPSTARRCISCCPSCAMRRNRW